MSEMGPVTYESTPTEGVVWHEYADIFPWLEGANRDHLTADIAANGVLEPIVFLGNAILDGRNRYDIARGLGIKYPRAEYVGADPLAFVISKNLHRRHLSESQRSMIAAKLAKMPRGNPSFNSAHVRNSEIDGGAFDHTANMRTDDAAQMLGVSSRSVESARAIERSGAPELIEAVERGDLRVRPAAEIARLPQEEQAEAVAKHVRGTFGTGQNEWYTPDQHLELAREVLGSIDLDPATSELANERVCADRFFTVSDDGLEQTWFGNVWLNPPYAQPAIAQFAEKLVTEWGLGNLTAAIVLTHNYTDTAWFQRLAHAASAICFTRGRVRFVSDTGELAAPTQGQAFFYFGHHTERFESVFAEIGFVAEVYAE